MGIFDSIKNALGKAEARKDELLAPEPDAPGAQPPEQAPGTEQVRSYTVQSGDTLWRVAERVYGDGSKYQEIFDANASVLESPDQIFPGQELVIPPQ